MTPLFQSFKYILDADQGRRACEKLQALWPWLFYDRRVAALLIDVVGVARNGQVSLARTVHVLLH
jgi:hypothetical protein